tara:strand:+ start:19994 stop:20254 length:261 start_codon:yes stop_codon:yes gene_type:complete
MNYKITPPYKYYALILFIFTLFNASAQTDFCGTNDGDFNTFSNNVHLNTNQNVTMQSFLDEDALVLKVHFYDVRHSQETMIFKENN